MPKNKGGSLQASRKKLLAAMSSNHEGKYEDKVIRFTNDDVPNFLAKLGKFKEESRKGHFVVK